MQPPLANQIGMNPYWETILEPLLILLHPQTIVEIGSEYGDTTRLLLAFCCRHNATLHSIDPAPKFDIDAEKARYGHHFIFHEARSLRALTRIERYDAVLIDGDHNWYTVFHELTTIEAQSADGGSPFPMVFLHDVDWPYGRRDMYYDPATIPVAYRHSFARKGIRFGDSSLQESGGMPHLCYHATTESSPRNGVRTAIEDYLKETALSLEFISVPGFHGLGLLFPRSLRCDNLVLGQMLNAWIFPPPIRRYLEYLEAARLKLITP